MRILFLVPHPFEGPSTRYRILQYFPHFERLGIECTASSFLSTEFYRIAYQPGQWAKKMMFFVESTARRLRDIIRAGQFDMIVIHLEAFPLGPPWIEWLLHRQKIPFVFDLDDALFLRPEHSANPVVRWLRSPEKLPEILRWSRAVVTCNGYLAQYVRQYNSRVFMIPTSVDTEHFISLNRRLQRTKPVIGWIGSHSTLPYLSALKPILERLARRYSFTLKVVGSRSPFSIPGVNVVQEDWRMDREVACFQEIDIGVYPLPKERWVLGKTGFKTVQYMSVGVPCVVSHVGRNIEIVTDGVNGFLANSEEEWVDKLSRLLEDVTLREQLGREGRRTVEARFSMQNHVSTYYDIFRNAAGSKDCAPCFEETRHVPVNQGQSDTTLKLKREPD